MLNFLSFFFPPDNFYYYKAPTDFRTFNIFFFFFQTLTVFTFDALLTSKVFSGFSGEVDPRYKEIDYYNAPRIRFPIQFALVCFSVACFNAAATLETTLSMLLGRLHRFMVGKGVLAALQATSLVIRPVLISTRVWKITTQECLVWA